MTSIKRIPFAVPVADTPASRVRTKIAPSATPTTGRQAGTRPRIALFSGNYNCVRDGGNQALNRLVAHIETAMGWEFRVFSPTVSEPAFVPGAMLRSMRSMAIPCRAEYRLARPLPPRIRRELRDFAPTRALPVNCPKMI